MDYAFTDQMVRQDPSLREAAEKYVQDYKGSFMPVLQARQALVEGHELNVAEIRTVLNIMRADTSIRILCQPSPSNVIEFPKSRAISFAPDDLLVDKPSPRWRRHAFSFKPQWTHGMSMHKRAEVIHDLDRIKSYAEYYPRGSWHHGEKIWEPKFEFFPQWKCGAKPPYNRPNIRLLTAHEADQLLRRSMMRMCPSCDRIND